MKKIFLRTDIMLLMLLMAQAAVAQIPDGYYTSLKGKKGAELKTAVHNIIKDATVLDLSLIHI